MAAVAKQSGLSLPTIRAVEGNTATVRSLIQSISALDGTIMVAGQRATQIGLLLSKERHKKKISQRSMAKMLGVTQPTIVALEVRETCRMVTLQKYIETLRLDVTIVASSRPRRAKLVPSKNDAIADKVYTPQVLAVHIIQSLPLAGDVLDPCRGDGAFYNQFPDNVDRHWCEIDEGRDFLEWQRPVDWVVTNPPWSKFRSFLNQGMTVADNVVYLAAITHFSTKARVSDIRRHGFGMRSIIYVPTPKEWPQSGFQMAAVWVQRGWDGPCDVKYID